MANKDLEVIIADDNLSIVKEDNKCISCGYCKKVCENEITVARMYDINKSIKPICINCGQCANMCPTESIRERFEYLEVEKHIKNKEKIIIVSIAPAVRVALAEEFGINGVNIDKKIVSALKSLGVDYVFDITFGADLTITEEAMELVNRIKNNDLPMFTSCCPSWVKYAEIFYPSLLPRLSTCKSPITMQSTLIKTYFSKVKNIKPEDIVNIVVAPCSAKKTEVRRKEINRSIDSNNNMLNDTDYLLTTRELVRLFKDNNIEISSFEDTEFDSPLGSGSTAGLIFGATGGVAEAAIRTAYYYLTGNNLGNNELTFTSIRGMADLKEAIVTINDKTIRVAVANGMKSATELINKILNKEVEYDFIEVMNCKGGCIAGGGQPKITLLNMQSQKEIRMKTLYDIDNNSTKRLCHENPEIKEIYSKYLDKPGSQLSEKLLHTYYEDKSYLLGGVNND